MLSRTSQRLLKSRFFSTTASPSYNITKLNNGVRVATAQTNDVVATVGVVVNTGSRFENASNLGTTGALRRIAFKSTQNVSELRLAREFETVGANYTVGVGKEQIVYSSEVPAEKVSQVLPLLAEVLSPRVAEYEVRFSRSAIQQDTELAESNGTTLLFELVHREAYRNKGLGQSAYTPSYRVKRITDKVVQDFINSNYSNERLTVVATGDVDHAAIVQQVEQLLGSRTTPTGSATTATANATEKSEYVGGEFKVPGDFGTHLAIAFEGVSLANSNEYFTSAVLQAILGNGQRLVFEGPGYGKTSRLARNVVDKNEYIEQAQSFNVHYQDSGLFGVLAVTNQAGHAGQLATALTQELKGLTSHAVTAEEVERAKETVRAHTLYNSETRQGLLEFVVNQLNGGNNNKAIKSPSDFISGVNAVTAQQVQALAKKIFQSTPTIVALGDVVNVPSLESVKKSIH